MIADRYLTPLSPLGWIGHTVSCLKLLHHNSLHPTGSRSSQSDFSDDQKEGKGITQKETAKHEANIQDMMADCLSDGSAQGPPTHFSGSHGDKDTLPASQGQHNNFSSIQPEISRQSFRLAMGNPSDLFVDVM